MQRAEHGTCRQCLEALAEGAATLLIDATSNCGSRRRWIASIKAVTCSRGVVAAEQNHAADQRVAQALALRRRLHSLNINMTGPVTKSCPMMSTGVPGSTSTRQ